MEGQVKGNEYSKGYTQATISGSQNLNIGLAGIASFFRGIAITKRGSTNITATLIINDNRVIDQVNIEHLGPKTNNQMPFVPFPRKLSGSDTITLTLTGDGADTCDISVYYVGSKL